MGEPGPRVCVEELLKPVYWSEWLMWIRKYQVAALIKWQPCCKDAYPSLVLRVDEIYRCREARESNLKWRNDHLGIYLRDCCRCSQERG